ncbi:MAG TPA: pyridoxal phosphate-dependent aminotransferase [Vicinamibacterales bacterium]
MSRVSSSPTMKGLLAAERLRRQGIDVVDLGAGEPDFPTPEHIKAAARAAIDADFTKYTPNTGTLELRQAICDRYRTDYGVELAPDQVIVTAGGKQALANAALALFGPGDEVITHAPGWPSIPEQIKLADATPVIVRAHAEDGFALHAEAFIEAITPRTRGFVINSPCNPTGALMSEEALTTLAREARRRDLWIVLDLCYEKLIHEPVAHNLPGVLARELPERSIVAGSASKAYAMTGWRCGWALGPREAIAACGALQSHQTSNVCSITQKAVVAALTGPQDCVTAMRDAYRERRDRVWSWLTADPRIRCVKPAGAFYLFLDITGLLSPGGVRTSAEFADRLIEEAHVVTTAGEAFDAPGFLRISYANSLDRLKEACDRLSAFVEKLDRAQAVGTAGH